MLHTDGGPDKHVRKKKFRGKQKKKPVFSVVASELSSIKEKMKKLKPSDRRTIGELLACFLEWAEVCCACARCSAGYGHVQ